MVILAFIGGAWLYWRGALLAAGLCGMNRDR